MDWDRIKREIMREAEQAHASKYWLLRRRAERMSAVLAIERRYLRAQMMALTAAHAGKLPWAIWGIRVIWTGLRLRWAKTCLKLRIRLWCWFGI